MRPNGEQNCILCFIRDILRDEISEGQATLLKSIYGIPLTRDEIKIYETATERKWTRRTLDKKQHDVTVIVGRRGGKTGRIGLPIALYEAILGGHEKKLGEGERGHIILMAQTMRAVREAMSLAKHKIAHSPFLMDKVVDDQKQTVGLASEVAFKNGMVLSIWPCSFTSIRGMPIPVCVMDEVGFWDVEGVNPDTEVVRAVRPAAATFPGRMLIKLSTPWAKKGVLWDDYEHWYGKDGGPLVWHATTRDMNPAIPLEFFIEEHSKDPEASRREYDAIFVDPQAAFLPNAAINAAVDVDLQQRKVERRRQYFAAVDVAFKNDAFVLTIGHRRRRDPDSGLDEDADDKVDEVVVDVWRAWRPQSGAVLDSEQTIFEVARELRRWGCSTVWGDQYCSEPIRAMFRKYHVAFVEVTLTASRVNTTTVDNRRKIGASKQDIMGNMKTLLLQGRLRLLDIQDGLKELRNLETKRTWGGYEQIGAPPGLHDDFALSLAMMCWQAWQAPNRRDTAPQAIWRGPTLMDWEITDQGTYDDDILNPHSRDALRDSQQRVPDVNLGMGLAYYAPKRVDWP